VKAVLRRREEVVPAGEVAPVVRQGELTIAPDRHEATVGGEALALTPIEFKILYFLASHPGRVYTRQRIIDEAQGEDVTITERTVDVHVVSLRRKLGSQAALLETVRGVGYRFKD
jgi:two-component system phosphate regulon response regulator PhoB